MRPPLGFHPEDPTAWLWKLLLKPAPSQHWRRPLTKQQKEEKARASRIYFSEHEHPRKGRPFKNK